MNHTKIEWTDGGSTWNPIRARNRETGKDGWFCIHESDGCRFCYAEAINRRLGTGIDFKAQNRNKVEIYLDEKILMQPFRWRRPRMIFANSMTDWMADFVPDAWISAIIRVVESCPQHIFQTLTKRAARQRRYFDGFKPLVENLWLGISAEDEPSFDERWPLMRETPAAVRFLSVEPMLGLIDFAFDLRWPPYPDWVIVGGESGRGARAFNIEWARSIIWQCREAGVPCFVKQLGAWTYERRRSDLPRTTLLLRDRKGGDPSEWPEDLRVREWPERIKNEIR